MYKFSLIASLSLHKTRLVGVSTAGDPIMVILEYCEHGALKTYLEKNEGITEAIRMSFAGDCAAGLAYLSSRGFIHRDIASRNVLLSSEKKCKISDVSGF